MKTSERIKKAFEDSGKSYVELEKTTGISKSTLQRYANDLTDKIPLRAVQTIAEKLNISASYLMGWIENDYYSERNNVDVVNDILYINVPLFSNISCGSGMFVEDAIDEYIQISDRLLNPNKKYFAQIANGNSMIDENINNGDVLIFEKTSIIENGQVGCFCVDDNMATCKKFYKDDTSNIIMLQPANDDHQPIVVTVENMAFHVVGKLKLVINRRD